MEDELPSCQPRRCGSWPCATTTVPQRAVLGLVPPAARSEYRGRPPTTTGQRGTPTRCRRRSSTSRKRRTATVEPQVNDRPDQRSVLGPRRFWRAGRRFRRWPSQSRSHLNRVRQTWTGHCGSAPAVPFRQSPFPGRLDTGPSTVPRSPHSTPRCWAFPWHLRGTLATYRHAHGKGRSDSDPAVYLRHIRMPQKKEGANAEAPWEPATPTRLIY